MKIAKNSGFTLIELLIAVAIVGIIAAIAYPSYNDSVRKVRREEAKRTLLEAAQSMENYYAMALDYTGAIENGNDVKAAVFTPTTEFSDYYLLQATNVQKAFFTLNATPKSGTDQASDVCGKFELDSTGRTSAVQANCW